MTTANARITAGLRTAARGAGLVVLAVGTLVLLGWVFDVGFLRSLSPRFVTMKMTTAASLALAGVAIFRQARPGASMADDRIARLCAAGVVALAAISLIEIATDHDLGIDLRIVGGHALDIGAAGRMAPASAIALICTGLAILALDVRPGWRITVTQWLILPVFLISGTCILGYVFGAEQAYAIRSHSSVAIHTALALGLVASGTLLLRPDRGVIAILSSDAAGGVVGRRLLPALTLIPLLFAWARLAGERAGLYGSAFGVALQTTVDAVFLVSLGVWSIGFMIRTESARVQSQQEVSRRDGRLRAAEQFQSFVEGVPVGIVILREGRFVYVNPAYVEMLGYESASQLIGRLVIPDFIDSVDRRLVEDRMTLAVVEGRVPRARLRVIRRDGSVLVVESTALPFEFEGTPSLIYVVRDPGAEIALERFLEEREALLREKTSLLHEVHHRVKNNLQVISSLLNLQARQIQDKGARAIFLDTQSRVRSIALLHETLYQSNDLGYVDMKGYVEKLVATIARTYGQESPCSRFVTAIDGVHLSLDAAVPCGLIVNELVTNALKHAFRDAAGNAGNEVRIEMTRVGDDFTMSVADNGLGFASSVDPARDETMGLTLVRDLSLQLRGHAVFVPMNGGAQCVVTFPAPGLPSASLASAPP